MTYQPIENYGVIGDLHTVALVGMDGSIDFMCFPHFDSPSIFASILDKEKGGCFRIAPNLEDVRLKQMYLPDTNVLITRFLSETGVGEVSDFMPVEEVVCAHTLVRRAKAIRGQIKYRMVCDPKFNYGRSDKKVEVRDNGINFTSKGEDGLAIFLRSSVPIKIINGVAVAEFTLSAGETAFFILEEGNNCNCEKVTSNPKFVSDSFKKTVNYWRNWVNHSKYQGRWREIVHRSALLLKLLTSKTHGSIVAAPTFGLPEDLGGERNWDYRYTWIRDASFTLYGLIRLGFTHEAADFMKWIEKRCGELCETCSLQIMYGIDGRRKLTEKILDNFEGYKGSSPVRIGNNAYNQLQLDIYGELLDAIYLHNKYGEPISNDFWKNILYLVNWVCKNWMKRDEGIWEIRGENQEFLYSRLMCWVAIDRGIRLAERRSFPAPLEKWIKIRDEIYNDIMNNFWNDELKAFVQYKGSKMLDASTLIMPLVKFISPNDPQWLSTLEAIEKTLVDDSLVFRYKSSSGSTDGLHGDEGTFSMCSFWYIECVARAGDIQKARFLFEKMLSYSNHLGLYSEELGPRGEHLGNFPQAFTHLALISAAYFINRELEAI